MANVKLRHAGLVFGSWPLITGRSDYCDGAREANPIALRRLALNCLYQAELRYGKSAGLMEIWRS